MMKAIGIVRKLDELGRVVIPIEIRRTMEIEVGDPLEIYTYGGSIILKKYWSGCVFCGDSDGISTFKGKTICHRCKGEAKG